jgi:DNA-binding transcriptional ArsR family regulator
MRNRCVTLLRVDAVYAIADPVRREILELLRSAPMSAGAIAAEFTISRPAISRHLRVLRDHGLVVDEPDDLDGRGRVYRLDTRPLRDVDAWLAQFRPGFASALDAHETEVHRTRRERRTSNASPNRRRKSA